MPRLLSILFLLFSTVAQAQIPADTLEVALPDVVVEADQSRATLADSPYSITILSRPESVLATDPGEALEPLLRRLPGVWAGDRENFALGERLAVRGMGARAGFGVRGVRVMLDGIPLTLADGQTAMTIVDPGLIRNLELVRGPASSAWGNSSGGVLFLETIPATDVIRARAAGGSYGLIRTEAEAITTTGDVRGGLAISHVRREGYRDHSAFETTRLRGFGQWRQLRIIAALEHAPHQEHPGALTEQEFRETPRIAQQNFVDQQAGKAVTQGQFGVAFDASVAGGTVRSSAFGLARSLENPLPFAYIEVGRIAGGMRTAYDRQAGLLLWSVGTEIGIQRDDRQNHANVSGERGELRLDQLEMVTNTALFTTVALRLENLTISAGLRGDRVHFAVDDRMRDESGNRTLSAISPSVGLSWQPVSGSTFFSSFATGFDTPTTTELANRPDGQSGFNAELDPQYTQGYEIGMRNTFYGGRILADVATFLLNVRDQIAAFEGMDGRTYYRNAEATRHVGIEMLLAWEPRFGSELGISYTWNRNTFSKGDDMILGNRVPGVPEHQANVWGRVTAHGVAGRVNLLAASHVWADDTNTAQTPAFFTLDLNVSYDSVRFPVTPFIQITNLLNAHYAGSVALNANAGRYFEPAAGRSLQFGVSWKVRG